VVRKAVSAIDWSFRVRPERYLGFSATVRTGCIVHFLRTSETSAVAVSSPEGVSSVIKTHFASPPLMADILYLAIKIRSYTFFY
jgi:hypothetical protein